MTVRIVSHHTSIIIVISTICINICVVYKESLLIVG